MKSVSSKVSRARPLLGTFVEVTAQGSEEKLLRAAVEKAFTAVSTVHRLMNFHDPKSDVGRLNLRASKRPLRVHSWTRNVLQAAKYFSRLTEGALDITVAPLFRQGRYAADGSKPENYGDWSDIILDHKTDVFFRRPLLIDLGGMAKGFAVDRAIEALAAAGATGGVVNAGGDLRVFGPSWHTAHIRHPLDLAPSGREIRLRNRSFATSVISPGHDSASNDSPFVDGRFGRIVTGHFSASVTASDCLTADTLTKAALIMQEEALPLLRQHGASALFLGGDSLTCQPVRKNETRWHEA